MERYYYRWIVVNNQETCYCQVVCLLEGLFKTAEDVKDFYGDTYCFKEHLFGVKKLEFSETPEWIAIKTGEILNENV